MSCSTHEESKTRNHAITLSLLIPISQSESTPPSSFTSVQKGKSKIDLLLCTEWAQQGVLLFSPSGSDLIQSSIRPNFGETQSVIYAALPPCWVEGTLGVSKLVLWPRPSAISQIHRTTEQSWRTERMKKMITGSKQLKCLCRGNSSAENGMVHGSTPHCLKPLAQNWHQSQAHWKQCPTPCPEAPVKPWGGQMTGSPPRGCLPQEARADPRICDCVPIVFGF